MENKILLKKIAAIYEADPEKGKSFLDMLFKASEEDFGDGYSILDNPDNSSEDDAAAEFLAEQEGKKSDKKETKSSDWKAGKLTDKQKSEIDKHLKNGYSEREAHRMVDAYKEEPDFAKALKSRTKPSMMSDKRINEMKKLAKEWLNNADKHEKLNADMEKNPYKHASGKMMAAHEQHMGNYKKAYNDFLNSESMLDENGKKLTGRARHEAIKNFKKDYRSNNPEHINNIANASQSQQTVNESRAASKQNLQDKLSNIITGGFSPDETHNTETGAQHAGINLGREGNVASGSISKDPLSSFADKNQKLVSMLSDEQKNRFDRINSAANAAGKQRTIATTIRRKKEDV